jgi:hypothetical protein
MGPIRARDSTCCLPDWARSQHVRFAALRGAGLRPAASGPKGQAREKVPPSPGAGRRSTCFSAPRPRAAAPPRSGPRKRTRTRQIARSAHAVRPARPAGPSPGPQDGRCCTRRARLCALEAHALPAHTIDSGGEHQQAGGSAAIPGACAESASRALHRPRARSNPAFAAGWLRRAAAPRCPSPSRWWAWAARAWTTSPQWPPTRGRTRSCARRRSRWGGRAALHAWCWTAQRRCLRRSPRCCRWRSQPQAPASTTLRPLRAAAGPTLRPAHRPALPAGPGRRELRQRSHSGRAPGPHTLHPLKGGRAGLLRGCQPRSGACWAPLVGHQAARAAAAPGSACGIPLLTSPPSRAQIGGDGLGDGIIRCPALRSPARKPNTLWPALSSRCLATPLQPAARPLPAARLHPSAPAASCARTASIASS